MRLPNGTVKRVRRKDVIASKRECPTRQLAQRRLDARLGPVNGRAVVLPAAGLSCIEVVLCDSCRERLMAALQAGTVTLRTA